MSPVDDPVATALARHRFAASPAGWCDPSWLEAVVRAPAADVVRATGSRVARAYLDQRLLDRFAPASCDDPALWEDPALALAILPPAWHDALLKAFGLTAMGLTAAALADDRPRVAAAQRALASLDAWPTAPGSQDRLRLAAIPTDSAALALGGQVLLGRLDEVSPPARARWRLRLPRALVRRTAPSRVRPSSRALGALARRLHDPDTWGGVPCW